MRLTFLGTSAGAPTRYRNVSAIGLQFIQRSTLWLFDCGEGTQQQVLRSPLRLSQLERIFITHVHGDHLYGLPGLLASRSLQYAAETPVTVYGPPSVADYLQSVFRYSEARLGYPVTVVAVEPGLIYEDDEVSVWCAPLEHRVTTFGYALVEKPQPGRFKVEEAAALGIPPGPLYGQLKNGQVVTLPDGRTIDGATLVGPARPGRKIVYCSDTVYCQNAIDLSREADVLIHEATYATADLDLAERGGHSTAAQAAQVARAAGVKSLILTHFSGRYEAKEGLTVDDLLHEAQALFPDTYAAADFWSYEIARSEPASITGNGLRA